MGIDQYPLCDGRQNTHLNRFVAKHLEMRIRSIECRPLFVSTFEVASTALCSELSSTGIALIVWWAEPTCHGHILGTLLRA